ncbi:acetylcholine receptor subunit alpha-type acr-16-like isoform X3 [Mya arenaria]|nr:acetylcholine receptor subunit alpha-type acr-16-like isoform X3 [Mya arenaria]XP_052796738.1 acetylcholine receptor subunit alpha-type acr-16-like isoform X3 [Mya arenaria]XP_052796739.1 acetylcholine receptor subunit alpha-type acr-16-like isoform X3 [Mya arenaria]
MTSRSGQLLLLGISGLLFCKRLATGCEDDVSSYCASRFQGIPESEMTQEQQLLYHLMRGYDRASRPVFEASKPVVINIGLSLTQVLDIDEKNQILTINVWLDQEWIDERLVWSNMSEFSHIKTLRVPCDLLWLPDIVLYNSVDNHNKGYMKALAMVQSTGNVFWPPIVRMRSSCKMDITFFPFDDQICKLKLGSWAYDGFQVDVSNRTGEVDLSNFVDNGEWTLVETRVKRNVIFYPCCPEPFPDVTFYIQLRRRVLYYFLNVIIPCMLLSALTLTGFCLPPESGEKVTLGLTVLLAFSVFMLLIAENMPPTSEFVPLIGVYLTIIMAMSAMSVVFSVFVLNFHHKNSSTKPPPAWIKTLARLAATITCSKIKFSDISQTWKSTQNYCERLSPQSNYSTPQSTHFEEVDACQSLLLGKPPEVRPQCTANQCNGTFVMDGSGGGEAGRPSRPVEKVILEYVTKVLSGYDRQYVESQTLHDWREVARVLDRVFFLLFITVTLLSTIITLIVCPVMKNIKIDNYVDK